MQYRVTVIYLIWIIKVGKAFKHTIYMMIILMMMVMEMTIIMVFLLYFYDNLFASGLKIIM